VAVPAPDGPPVEVEVEVPVDRGAGGSGDTGGPGGGDAPPARRRIRLKAVLGLLGLVGLVLGAVSTVDDAGDALPEPRTAAFAVVLLLFAMVCAAGAWVALFPPTADRRALARGLYTSQLTKYLPAGGFVQAASQVALSNEGGMAAAALRLPVYSACAVAAAATVGSALVLEDDLPPWGRAAAVLGLACVAVVDRRVLRALLGLARRVVKRLPEPDALPPQAALLRCYGLLLANVSAYAVAFFLLLDDVADSRPVATAAAFCAGWALGYLALPLPSGLIVREAVLLAALPVTTSAILAASVAHRLLAFVAEVALAGVAHLRAVVDRRRAR
jgi:hypothetical protein